YTKLDINYAAGGNLRRLSAEEAWESIEDCAQYAYDEPIGDMEDKEDNPSPQSPGDGIRINPNGVAGFATGRKAHLLEDKQIPSVGVFDEVFSTWIVFGGNTRDLGSFGEETNKTTTLHQILEEVVHTECGDGVACFKRRPQDV
ncbi:hypothetical protein Tco_1223323, partial [Tanacetum coccineum]